MRSKTLTGLSLEEWRALRTYLRITATPEQLRILARDYIRMKRKSWELGFPNLPASVAFALVSRELRRRGKTSFLPTRAPND